MGTGTGGGRAGTGDKRPREGLVLASALSWEGSGGAGTVGPPFFQGMEVIIIIIYGALG